MKEDLLLEEDGVFYTFENELYFSIHLRKDISDALLKRDGAYQKFDNILTEVGQNTAKALQDTFDNIFGVGTILVVE
jgi:hypothetical protein